MIFNVPSNPSCSMTIVTFLGVSWPHHCFKDKNTLIKDVKTYTHPHNIPFKQIAVNEQGFCKQKTESPRPDISK